MKIGTSFVAAAVVLETSAEATKVVVSSNEPSSGVSKRVGCWQDYAGVNSKDKSKTMEIFKPFAIVGGMGGLQ